MEISPIQLFRLLLSSFAFGGMLGLLNDLQRGIRMLLGLYQPSEKIMKWYARPLPILHRPLRFLPKKRRVAEGIVMGIQDVVWFAGAGAGTVILNYTFNDGKIRIYTFLGMLFGILIYRLIIGIWSKWLLERLIFFLRAFFAMVFAILFAPFLKIFVFFRRKVNKLLKIFRKALEKKRKKVYNMYGMNYYLQGARTGFLDHPNGRRRQ